MKVYLAQGESRKFEFSAIGRTRKEAENAIIGAFKAHARHYDLPLNWWKEHADYHIILMESGKLYRDRSAIDEKWYSAPELTDEELLKGITLCDCCETKAPSVDMFWDIDWEEHTDGQKKVINLMQRNGYDCVCQDCFEELKGE